jgi:flagellar basal-body rod protein FlgB
LGYLTSNSQVMMEKCMSFLWTKQTAILDNISNVETPEYKAKYVTFEEALRNRLQSAAGDANPSDSIQEALNSVQAVTHVASGESARMDGNGVDLTEQGVELARNSYQLQYAMRAISGDLSILSTAIKGQ